MSFLSDSDCNHITPEKVNNKRKSADNDREVRDAKRSKIEQSDNEVKVTETKESKSDKTKDSVSEEKESGKSEEKESDKSEEKESGKEGTGGVTMATSSKSNVEEKDDIEENLICMICQEIMHDCIRFCILLF